MKLIKKTITRYWDLIILFTLIILYSATFSTLSILRHNAFASNYDLANMSQTVWNTLHGRIFALSGAEGTISRFSIHADLILVLLSPLYLIWERAYMLLIVQSIALGLGALPAYFLSIKVLSKATVWPILIKFLSLAVVIAYLLNPAMEWSNIYDFHGVTLAIPFLLSVFYFAYTKHWKWFWFFVFFALSTKEEVSLLISMIGLALFFVFKEKKIGIITFVMGISWFAAMILFVIPYFSSSGSDWAVNDLYSSALQRISDIRTIPQAVILFKDYFLLSDATNYYIALLKPFSFIPILGLPWLFMATPELLVNLLSDDAQMKALTFHYDSGITPFLIIGMIFGLSYLIRIIEVIKPLSKYKNQILIFVALVIISVAIRVNYHYSPLPSTPSCWCLSYRVSADDINFAKVLATIPLNFSVTSSGEVRPHLARRENSFTLPGQAYTADYVAMIDENRIVGDYSPKEFENFLLKDSKFLNSHLLLNHIGHFYLFKKKTT